jgi:hypothetical protein
MGVLVSIAGKQAISTGLSRQRGYSSSTFPSCFSCSQSQGVLVAVRENKFLQALAALALAVLDVAHGIGGRGIIAKSRPPGISFFPLSGGFSYIFLIAGLDKFAF